MEGVGLRKWTWLFFLFTNVVAQSYSGRGSQKSSVNFLSDKWPEKCPLACRCSRIRPGHELLRRWQGLTSSSDVRMLENAIDHGHRFRRDFSSGVNGGTSGRDMMCMGLRELPSSVPSDIIRLSVFGEEMVSNETSAPISYDQSKRPSSIMARQSIFQKSNQLSTIRKSAFMRSRDLLELSIVGNDVMYISPAQFENLPNLVLLNLKGNNLKSLESQTFRGLYHLEELRLSQNDLYVLPSGLLDYAPRIKKLYLDKNQIRTLQMDSFHSLRDLQILDLSSNKLRYLPRTVFAKNRHLRELYLDENMLDGVKSEWFSHALQLQKLSMNRNKISRLDPGSLTVVRMLYELSLSGNHITRIHATTLRAFHKLHKLDLSNNRIGAIPPETFQRTSKLTELNLSKNKVTAISQDVFGRPSALKLLDLSDNMINVVERENFHKLGNLEKLDLSGNGIKDLMNGTFLGLRKLRELNLAKNKILNIADRSFSVSLSRFVSQLTWLNLQHNRISSVFEMGFRTVPHLKFLNLAFNEIEYIHKKAFESQRHLNTLLVNNNLFNSLPSGVFSSLKNVRHLNIGYNKLRELHGSVLKGLTRLDELNAQGNNLTFVLQATFQEIPNLVRANFSGNSIQYADMQSFSTSATLSHLDLSGNNLSDVKASEAFGNRLKFLSLAQNHLTTLHSDITNSMATGGELALQNNPWYCDCHLSWLQYLVRIWQLRLLNTQRLRCNQPKEHSGKQILSLRQTDFSCGPGSVNRGSPAIRPPVRERHNRPHRKHRTTYKPRRNYHPTTTSPLRPLLPAIPKHRSDPRFKYDKSNIIPNVTPKPVVSPKKDASRNTRRKVTSPNVTRTGIGKQIRPIPPRPNVTRTGLGKQIRPIPPRPNLVTGPQKPWYRPTRTTKKPETKNTAAPQTRLRYPWWGNATYTSKQNISLTTKPPFTVNQWWRNHLYRSRQNIHKIRPINQTSQWWRNGTFAPSRHLHTTTPPYKRRNPTFKPRQATPGPTSRTTYKFYRHETTQQLTKTPSPPRILSTTNPSTRAKTRNSSNSRRNHGKGNIYSANWWKPISPYYTTALPVTMPAPTRHIYTNAPHHRLTKRPSRTQKKSWLYEHTKPPPKDTTRRNNNGKRLSTPKPVRNPDHRGDYSRKTKLPINRSYHRTKPTQHPYTSLRKTSQKPYVLTLPTTLKTKPTASSYLPNSHPKMIPQLTTIRPITVTTGKKKTHQSGKHNNQNYVPLGCSLNSGWRLHFDKTLIRRHKSEVKNYHVTVMNSRRKPGCNGVLLSDWWILTSASCIERNLANRAKLKSSSWSPRYHVKIGLRELNKVIGIVVHPLYLSRRSDEHDFALLRLKYDSLMTKAFTPPCVMPPEWFHSRAAWVVPGVASARFDSRKPRSNLQTLSVKVWETDCERNPASCLRIQDRELNSESAFTDGAPLYLGYSETRWSLVGLGRSSVAKSDPNKYLPVWTVLNWLKTVIENS